MYLWFREVAALALLLLAKRSASSRLTIACQAIIHVHVRLRANQIRFDRQGAASSHARQLHVNQTRQVQLPCLRANAPIPDFRFHVSSKNFSCAFMYD
jgi:hypothetical protein